METAHTALYYAAFAFNCLAIVGLPVCFFYGVAHKPSKQQMYLCTLVLSTFLMVLGYMLEIACKTSEAAMLAIKFGYLGKPFIMLLSFFFICVYCGYRLPSWLKILLTSWSALFPILIFTNDYHHLYYASWGFNPDAEFTGLILERGPLYYVYMVSIFLYGTVIAAITVREYFRCRTKREKKQLFYFVLMVAFGILGYVVYLSGITKGYDATVAGVTLGSVMLIILFFRFHILDVINMAKERALDDMTNGLLAFDHRGEVVYTNTQACRLTEEAEYLLNPEDLPNESFRQIGERHYSIKKCPIEADGIFYGTLVEINDVTESRTYSEKLEKEVAERTEKIKFMQRSILAGLANIMEARNGETGYHIKRTADYVSLLTEELAKSGKYPEILSPKYAEQTVAVAPLHDVGKIAVPDSILLKPGKLTAEEFETMKEHSHAGAGIIEKIMKNVEDSEYVARAEEVAEYHHEKWDGSGYPHGLSGEQIPLCARIMALADVYDALRSDRCYKKAMSAEEARRIIVEGRGTHFDPAVVDAYLSCVDGFERTAESTGTYVQNTTSSERRTVESYA